MISAKPGAVGLLASQSNPTVHPYMLFTKEEGEKRWEEKEESLDEGPPRHY